MSRWGRVDFRELRELERKLDKLEKGDFDKFCREASRELAQRLLTNVIKRTPTGDAPDWIDEETRQKYWAGYKGGTLKKSWTISDIVKDGDVYRIEIINPVEYASYVEYGHRQQAGRYVPAIQRRLKGGWSPGRYMLTISMQQIENVMPDLLEKRLYAMLQRLF